MIVLENHCFVATIIIIDSGKNHQWTLKPSVKFVPKQNIYTVSNHLPKDYLYIIYGGKSIFTMKKSGRHHLNQVTKDHQ